MLNPNAKLWVEALRSGKYEQGTHYLEKDGKLCCLGVACRLYIEAGNYLTVTESHAGSTLFANEAAELPESVRLWIGLNDTGGRYGPELNGDCLVHQNDTGKTFEEIAAIIESEPTGLFVEESK